MTTNDPNPAERGKCPQCGAELPPGTAPELCPKCLLQAGLGAPAAGPQGTIKVPPPIPPQDLLQPGQTFGHYRIVRMIGGGGMGTVFEAEDLDSGRRVALKLLSHTLDSPGARERFFREGRLAASINHPNSVYVFGTEEIGGTPVISMELVSGGTLQDRVTTRGPMPWAEAVDATLQIVAGLEAAERVGILHRDVKPSNCFLDPEGMTKIGDFGLSISTAIRTEPSLTASGLFLGTPAFCSPEQLRGEELSVRADVYSVGATLFYLLTGRTPFEAKNMVALLATVLENPPPSPRQFAPDMPHGLARVVRRCLDKHPSERFRSYDELRQALAPYSSAAPAPAPLGLRFVAGLLDMAFLNLTFTTLTMALFGGPIGLLNAFDRMSGTILLMLAAAVVVSLCYYALPEGIWGVTAGKALCRLRVVGRDRNKPGLPQAFLRALIYIVVPMVPFWMVYGRDIRSYLSGTGAINHLMGFSFYILLALLFATARRRNGFAAIHDLVTRTRVITRARLQERPIIASIPTDVPAMEGKQTTGPYHILETLPGNEWRLGYDLRLLRKVWIRLVPPGTPPVPANLRNLGRPGRFRWLTGKRSAEENWDAYEAPAGQPLLTLAAQPQPWSLVRFWVHDLASEIAAATQDQTLPQLALDRVWITAEGRAKLLDFPVPALPETSSEPSSETISATISATSSETFPKPSPPAKQPSDSQLSTLNPQLPPAPNSQLPSHFLDTVAATLLAGQLNATQPAADVPQPVPLHARTFLKQLKELADPGAIAAALKPLLQRTAEVSRLRRAAVIAGCLAVPVPVIFGVLFGTFIMDYWQKENPGVMELSTLLQARWSLRTFQRNEAPDDQQFAVYIASHYRRTVEDPAIWSSPFAMVMIKGKDRTFAEESVNQYTAPTPEQVAKASEALKPLLPPPGVLDLEKMPALPFVAAHASLVIYVGLPALIAALLFRGGLLLRAAGITFVRRDGAPASRLRVFWRALVAWSPVAITTFLVLNPAAMKMPVRQLLILLGLSAIAAASLALRRSVPDQLAGTWPVLR